MPQKLLYDITGIDLTKTLYGPETIRQVNPQRGDMEHLNGIVWEDPAAGRMIGFKDVRADEFWCAGHMPGRPRLPGVLMLEAGAQCASFYIHRHMGWTGLIGFGGLDEARFRAQVVPGQKLYLVLQRRWARRAICGCDMQGLVDGNIAFEAKIIGVELGPPNGVMPAP
jgi:3-hydroxyacyl-[acyl-carrier-protein] dehydratase